MNKYIQIIKKFLTENTSSKQTVIKNTFWLLLAEGVSKGLNILLMFWLAKLVTVQIFGEWSFINAVTGFLVVVVDLGLQQIYVRDIIKSGVSIQKHLFHSVILKIGLGVGVFFGLFILSFFIEQLYSVQFALLIYMIYIILYNINEFLRSAFRGKEKMESEASIKLISGVLLTAIIAYTYLHFVPLHLDQVVVGYLISILVQLGVTLFVLFRHDIISLDLFRIANYDRVYIRTLWRSCLYLGLTSLFMYGYFQADQVIMRFYDLDYELGIYSAMYRIIQLLFFVTNTLLFAYMPHMLKSSANNHKRFDRLMLGLWLIICIMFGIFGKSIISLMYTPEYQSGRMVLMIQLVGLYFMMQNMTIQQKVLANHQESSLLGIFGLGLIGNVVGNYMVIPIRGIYGAACIMLGTQMLVFLLLIICKKR